MGSTSDNASSQAADTVHTAVLIGRFEPLHLGHMALLEAALQRAQQVVIVLGSAHQAPSPKNPFSWQERQRMLLEALPPEQAARTFCVPVRDYYNEPQWVAAVHAAVAQHLPSGASVALVGHFKDASSSYLARFPGWSLISLPRLGAFDATPIRDLYLGADPQQAQAVPAALEAMSYLVPASTLKFLREWAQTPLYQRMQQEWRMLRDYRAAWSTAPYPPVFVTVDALLQCQVQNQSYVLLICRGHAPGLGLWALPGGFLEPRDSLWQSCLRELQEETGLQCSDKDLHGALQAVQVFDHPDRSLRGRTITHVHHFDLGDLQQLPAVRAGDDAALAQWWPCNALASIEAQCFEDHFQILCQRLALTASHDHPPGG